MIVSGKNFRSLAERNELSFSAQVSLNNTTGVAELGFLGENNFSFKFNNGKIIDPENRYFNSYSKNESFILSGNLETGSYDYYIDGNLNCSIGVKDNFTIDQFYINTTGVEIDGNFYIYSSPQNYTVKYADKYVWNKSLLGNIYNNQEEEFKIFTGTVNNPDFELDTDVPTGNYDGTYIQDYRYYANSGDLDEFNGRFGITPEYPSGIYHYHVTHDWPYVMSCFKGESVKQVNKITEITSGSAPEGVPEPWLTGKFFDPQTKIKQSDNVRRYTEGPVVSYSDKYIYVTSKGIPKHFYGLSKDSNCECRPYEWGEYEARPQNSDWWVCYHDGKKAKGHPDHYGGEGFAAWGEEICLQNCCDSMTYSAYGLLKSKAQNFLVSQQDHIFKIPIYHTENSTLESLPMGPIGVAIDGVPIDLLSDEFYKDRGRWRLAVHPGQFGLDNYNAHVQPNGAYHYHAGFSGIINDHKFTTPSIAVEDIPAKYKIFSDVGFSKYSSAFGINIFATSGVKNEKVNHVANVLAEIIDNNQDGIPDNLSVLNNLVGNQASIIMASGDIYRNYMNFGDEGVSGINVTQLSGYHALQELKGTNVDHTGKLDKTLEYGLKLISDYGWSEVYPYTFGLLSGSNLANYMDSGRGGHFEWCARHKMDNGAAMNGVIHGVDQTCLEWGATPTTIGHFENGKLFGTYPSGSWYHNPDENCDYACQTSRYMYWGISTLMGANTGKYSEEWELTTPTGMRSGDLNFYNLLINPQYGMPTGYLPTGEYSPSSTETILGNTGHSPLIGFAFDGYPIYGPIGYTNALVSGEVKEMKSSYLPKNIEREAAYPKTIKQYNDLYLPYSVDLINKYGNADGQDVSVEIVLHTNFGDIRESLKVEEVTEWDQELKKLGYK